MDFVFYIFGLSLMVRIVYFYGIRISLTFSFNQSLILASFDNGLQQGEIDQACEIDGLKISNTSKSSECSFLTKILLD